MLNIVVTIKIEFYTDKLYIPSDARQIQILQNMVKTP